jgi:hypothetical protein
MKNYLFLVLAPAAAFWLLIIPACRQQPQTRQYEENDTAPTRVPSRPQAPSQSEFWRWEKPLQWREEKGVDLRLVTFFITSREGSGECALVTLPGEGGGIRANVQRWLEQLQLPLFSPSALESFLSRQKKMQTKSGLPVSIIDFTTLSGSQSKPDQSLLVAIIQVEKQTLFVKMRGAKALLSENREIFYKFCQSLSPGA